MKTKNRFSIKKSTLVYSTNKKEIINNFSTKKNNSKWFNKWQNEGAKKAVVKVNCEKDFFLLKEQAIQLKIAAHIISDAGHTEIPVGTKTVLGLGPAPDNIIDQVTGDLPLL